MEAVAPPFVATLEEAVPAGRARPARMPFQRPQLPPVAEILAYFAAADERRWYSNGGPCVSLLEERISARLGGVACVTASSATTALVAALRAACGAPDGTRREILTPAFTFTATACAIAWAGFEPVFVDIDPDHWHLCPEALADALRARGPYVAGVLACSTFGTAPRADVRAAWRELTGAGSVPLIVDSAPGFGACDAEGRLLGASGDIEVFSFHATKPFAVGEGGCLVTGDDLIATRARRLLNFGLEPGTRISVEAGINGKMSEWHAATGLAALERLDDVIATRQALAAALRSRLDGAGLVLQHDADSSTWQYFQCLAVDRMRRDAALERAAARGIEARAMHDPPLHRHPAFARAAVHSSLPVTEDLASRSLSLPLANDLTAEELDLIASVAPALLAC